MAKAVFMTRIDSSYDDLPELRYHFPRTYLNKAKQAVRDWILYYEPGKGGRMAYFATAYLERIIDDPDAVDRYYAIVSHYFEFPTAVPFKDAEGVLESALIKPDGTVNKGLFGRSVHLIPDHEYTSILMVGAGEYCPALQTEIEETTDLASDELRNPSVVLTRRAFRDSAFRDIVAGGYNNACALSGIKLVNGGGAAEVEAAHIRPVAQDGPDSPRNGIALSRTLHWAFDKGLLSLEDDGRILIARKLIPEQLNRLIIPDGIAHLPEAKVLHPHPQFLRFHRENVFRG